MSRDDEGRLDAVSPSRSPLGAGVAAKDEHSAENSTTASLDGVTASGRASQKALGPFRRVLAGWRSLGGRGRFALVAASFAVAAAVFAVVGVVAARGPWRVTTIDAKMAGDVKAVGDLDGDGFVDLVIGGKAKIEDMVWYRYPGWNKHTIASARNEFTTDMQLADVDRDGDPDIVVADGDGPDNVVWLENPRPARKATAPWSRHTIGSHGTWVHDLEVGDFDRDGRTDVVTRKDSTKLWFADKGGAFTQRDLSKLVGGGEGLGVGDVDADGDIDLIANCAWFENPGEPRGGSWQRRAICKPWDDALTAGVADVDGDGAPDVVITSQHKPLKLSVFSHAGKPADGRWKERLIDPEGGSHKINFGDFDLDGRLDIQLALEERTVVVYFNHGDQGFRKVTLPETGHNVRVGDIGRDGDLDLFGAGYTGHPPTRIWENQIAQQPPKEGTLPAGQRFERQVITDRHVGTFGLAFEDVDRDGATDIVSGPFWYRNEGRTARVWSQHRLHQKMHACLALDVDGDKGTDLIAQKDEGDIAVYWLERNGDAWSEKKIGTLPRASHGIGAQGQAVADLEPGGRPEIVMTSGRGTYYFVVPEEPEKVPWARRLITEGTSDEGIAVADMDGDGRVDVVTTSGETKRVEVQLNPKTPGEPWQTRSIGTLPAAVYLDRVDAADLDGDGRMDVVVTEENGQDDGAATHWFEQPPRPWSGEWKRRLLVVQASTNSLGVGDLDGDGDADIVLAEHRGALKVSHFENDGTGGFEPRILSSSLESHLGARLVDLDRDGDLDIVSIAWDEPKNVFVLWNDRRAK